LRFLVELEYSLISLDETEEERAWELFRTQGKRIFKCKDIFDEGELLAGPPVFKDLSKDENNEQKERINDTLSIGSRTRTDKQFN
jgi:hypothetical protein